MATKSYDAFLPEVAPYVNGAPEMFVINAIRNAAIDFCSSTFVWWETQDSTAVTAADLPLDLSAPSGARVEGVTRCKVNGVPIMPTTLPTLDAQPHWETDVGYPSAYYCPTPEQLSLTPIPSAPVDVVLRVAYTPTRNSTGVEAFIYERYLEVIAAGALYRLMVQPGKLYSNPSGATYNLGIYNAGVSLAAIAAQQGFISQDMRISAKGRN